jgi:Zn-dependent peptidase ImmA (M78 family)
VTGKVSDEFSRDRAGIERALRIKESFVRSDVQVSYDNPRAKGRRLTAAEVYFNFGSGALNALVDRGAFVIQSRDNSSSATLRSRVHKLRIPLEHFSDKLGVTSEKLETYLSGKEYFPIRQLEIACAFLGIEESRISAYKNEFNEPLVRLRYYNDKKGDVNVFDEGLVNKITSQTWKIGKIDYLKSMISYLDIMNSDIVEDDRHVDPVYSVPGAEKPTVEKGRQIAVRLRSELDLKKVRKRSIRVTDALLQIGAAYYADSMEDAFCGMTLISSWSGGRVVVTNTRGENARQGVRRFTLAHELAHAASDPDEKFVAVKVGGVAGQAAGSTPPKGSRDHPEMRANSFAANFLAPDDEMRAALAERPNENSIDVISDEFSISRSTAKWRLVSMRLAPQELHSGQDEGLFSIPNADIGDRAPSLNDELKRIASEAFARNLIHADTLESLLMISEKLDA